MSGPAGPPIDREVRSNAGRQETASETSGPGFPDRRAEPEALVNLASMVLFHDQGHEPDRNEEPNVSLNRSGFIGDCFA
jgi:hypothetical protein